MKTLILLLATLFVFSGSSIAATCVSIGSGDWSNPAIWSCDAVPSAGDNIICLSASFPKIIPFLTHRCD